jgi:hypothetical protein
MTTVNASDLNIETPLKGVDRKTRTKGKDSGDNGCLAYTIFELITPAFSKDLSRKGAKEDAKTQGFLYAFASALASLRETFLTLAASQESASAIEGSAYGRFVSLQEPEQVVVVVAT